MRVRIAGEHAWLNIKSATLGVERDEYEYAIPLADAERMLATLCGERVEKIRHHVIVAGHLFEVDEFLGDNAGLVVAETRACRSRRAVRAARVARSRSQRRSRATTM